MERIPTECHCTCLWQRATNDGTLEKEIFQKEYCTYITLILRNANYSSKDNRTLIMMIPHNKALPHHNPLLLLKGHNQIHNLNPNNNSNNNPSSVLNNNKCLIWTIFSLSLTFIWLWMQFCLWFPWLHLSFLTTVTVVLCILDVLLMQPLYIDLLR